MRSTQAAPRTSPYLKQLSGRGSSGAYHLLPAEPPEAWARLAAEGRRDAGGRTGPREDAASGRGAEAQEARAGSSWVPAGRGRGTTASVFLAPPPPTDMP